MFNLKNSSLKQLANANQRDTGLRNLAYCDTGVVIMAIFAVCNLAQAPVLGAEKPETGYELEQKSLLVGNVAVRVYPKAVQITDHGRGVIYVSRAPEWKVLIINPREKTYYEGPIDNFSGTMTRGVTLFTGRMLTDATYQPPTKQPDGTLLYTTSAEFLKRATENKKNITNSNGNPKTIDVWVNPLFPAPPRAVALMGRLFGFAPPPGIAVRVRYFDFDHAEKVYLKTFRSVKKEFTDADFEKRVPSYKQLATVAEVFRTKQQDEDVADMLGGFGDGLPSKKK